MVFQCPDQIIVVPMLYRRVKDFLTTQLSESIQVPYLLATIFTDGNNSLPVLHTQAIHCSCVLSHNAHKLGKHYDNTI